MSKFHLVDFAAHYQKGFRNHIVSIREVPELVRFFDRYGCYATYFLYSDEILTYMSARPGPSTIAGYEGKVSAPFFPIDLNHPDLTPALEAAKFLTSLALERWGVAPEGLQVYFSGSKGFHIMLDARLFGRIRPSKTLPLLFDAMRRHLAQELPDELRDTVDLSIKDRVRLLRLPNTVHEKSGLYKVILPLADLKNLTPEDIRQLATKIHPLSITDETGFVSQSEVRENEKAAQFFARIRRQLRRIARKPFAYRFRRPADLDRIEFPCAGAQKIWESHVEPGYRNNCAIRLASDLRLLGLTEDETRQKLFQWNENNAIGLPSDELSNVARSAYQHRFPYRYSCRDEILRRLCPLPDYKACQAHMAGRSESERSDF